MDIAIELRNLTFGYNKKKTLLSKANLKIQKSTVVGIIGASGVGKTSVLRIINGSLVGQGRQKISGSVYLNGQVMEMEEDFFRQTGTVYQSPDNQIIFSSVEDELAFGMENLSIDPSSMAGKIMEVLKVLGIEKLKERNPNELSGGEKQLVVLAAILCLDIEIIILDECMTQIDTEGRRLIMDAILRMKDNGKTVLMVEHDYENLKVADQVYRLKNQCLELVEKGSLEDHGLH